MMRALFLWFDTHPESYWAIAAVPTLLWLGSAFFPLPNRERQPQSRLGELVFVLLILATLVAWRWPYWLNADPYNPDESQFIAGAITLTRDPVFWRSVDGTTSGPLNFYALLPLHWLGMPLDYFTARVTAVLLVWIAIVACYRLIRSWYGVAAARLAVLPLTAFFACASDADFIHYSSEHVPLALMALAAAGLFGTHSAEKSQWAVLTGGLAAGMLPWAKLQTAPIAGTMVVFALWRIWDARSDQGSPWIRRGLVVVAAALLPSAIVIGAVGAAGQIENLFRDYVLQNFSYLDQNWSFGSALRQLWNFSLERGNLPVFGALAAGISLFGGIVGRFATKRRFVAAALLVCVAVACVLAPKRPSLHYTLLAIVPLGIWLGVAVGETWHRGVGVSRWRWFAVGAALGGAVLIFGLRTSQGAPDMFGRLASHWKWPRSAVGNIVRALTTRGDRLAVWGWMDRVYVETGLPQATHESETFEQIAPSRQREHYRERYVADLKRTHPAVFVDATGPRAPYFTDRVAFGHETLPALAEFVQTNYRLLTDLGDARIFVRSDRYIERPLGAVDLWRMITDARRDPDPDGPVTLSPKRLPRRKIYGQMVQMMLPPGEMVWALDGTEREVFLEYGFDPKAVTSGKGNGADILVELHPPEGPPRVLLNRSLDPWTRADDRGNLVSRIVLPPFPAGTKIAVRTTPGEFGDNAWDWVYVGQLDRVRAPFFSPSQFPHYSRVPDAIESEYISLLETPEEKLLMTHAPTTMKFRLKGDERRWQFDFGFQEGAYTGDGHTDGATFVIELTPMNQSPIVLFSRKLDPANVESDRGRLHAEVSLPALEAGDQLTMRIDPGPSPGWDWTYVTNLAVDAGPR